MSNESNKKLGLYEEVNNEFISVKEKFDKL